MKKLFAALLCLCLLFTCAALGEDDPKGTYQDNVYTNTTAGLTFTLPEGWTFTSQEDLLAMLDTASDLSDNEAYQQALEEGKETVIMAATETLTGNNINIGMSLLDEATYAYFGAIGEETYLEAMAEYLATAYEEMGMEVSSVTVVTADFSGVEKNALLIDLNYLGVELQLFQMIIPTPNYLYSITVTGVTDLTTALDAFRLLAD